MINIDKKHEIHIPMPFFDNFFEPEVIAIPLKNDTLKHVESKDAAFILVKFFSTAVGCLTSRKANKNSVQMFHQRFQDFLELQVMHFCYK